MSYNGSGTFVVNTAGQPVVTGTIISSTTFNALTADLATGLSTAVTKDGQTTPTANLPMGGFKLTGLANGSAATDSAAFGQILGNSYNSTVTAAGTTVLSNTSSQSQYFSGSSTQTVTLPVVTTLPTLGFQFRIVNLSSGSLTVNSSGGNLVATVTANQQITLTCILLTGTTAASWDVKFSGATAITGTGSAVRATNPELVGYTVNTASGVDGEWTTAGLTVYANAVTPQHDGPLHVMSGTAGAVTANASADEVVVEGAGVTGVSILAPDANASNLYFGSTTQNNYAQVNAQYNGGSPQVVFGTVRAGGSVILRTGNDTTAMTIDSAGQITKPLQPAFLAYNSVTDAAATGAGTVFTVDFDTEVYDQNSDFAADTFTAPVTGRYLLTASVEVGDMTLGGHAFVITRLVTSNRSYILDTVRPCGTFTELQQNGSAVADMDTADTAFITVQVNGGAQDVPIFGGGSPYYTYFSGCLVA